MGVAGSGKSTVGPRVATELGVPFFDADDFHDAAAKAQMAAGIPLDDETRRPWLGRLHTLLVEHEETGAVLACSALKRSYRVILRERPAGHQLRRARRATRGSGRARLAARHGHYAGPNLLASQLATFELGDDVVTVDATKPVDDVVAAVVGVLGTENRT